MVPDIEVGEFLYQSDSELFLVAIEEKEDHVLFAAHGWRQIGKNRLERYIEDDRSKIYQQDEIEQLIASKGDDEAEERFEELLELFEAYEDVELVGEGPHTAFALDDQ